MKTESRLELTRSWRQENRDYCLMGTELVFELIARVLETDSGDSFTTL